MTRHKGAEDEVSAVGKPRHDGAKLQGEIAVLGDLSRDELAQRWVKAYGVSPPKGVKRGLLERCAAWHIQARRLGGLSAEAKRALKRIGDTDSCKIPEGNRGGSRRSARASDANNAALAPTVPVAGADREGKATAQAAPSIAMRAKPRPGTRLLREWNGRAYVVDVTPDGFAFDGKTFRSLSAIARRITGAQWSGPRFFGL